MNPSQLIARLEKLHQELAGQVRAQAGLVSLDELEPLMDTWRRRRRITQEMTALYKRLAPYFENWEQTLAAMGPQQALKARQAVEEIRGILDQVRELDAENGRILADMKEKCNEDLMRLRQGSKVVRAYRRLPSRSWGPLHLSRTG